MSDLDREMNAWRQLLQQSGTISADDIAELESHLLQEIELLQKSGLLADEALIIATRRLGHPHELAVEYAKNDALMSWRRPAKLVLWGMLILKVMSLCWTMIFASMIYRDRWIFQDSPWPRSWLRHVYWLGLLVQAAALGLFWSLAEHPQGRIARGLNWLEQTVRTVKGTVCLILASVALDLAKTALTLLQLGFQSKSWDPRFNHMDSGIFSFNTMAQMILADMSWSVPWVVLLVILIRTEGWKSLARFMGGGGSCQTT